MIKDKVLNAILDGIKFEIEKQAHDSMQFPKAESFERGIQVGVYQGLRAALTAVENVLGAEEEAERKS